VFRCRLPVGNPVDMSVLTSAVQNVAIPVNDISGLCTSIVHFSPCVLYAT
jgi:hypothetical protein